MTDLVEFLRAALDEDERVALEAVDDYYYLDEGEATLRFLEYHDPARVLAEVAAKRAILDLHESWPVLVETEFSTTEDADRMTLQMSKRIAWLTNQEYRARFGDEPPTSPIIRAMAQPYAGRPGWREEWATGGAA
jgi:hypothetical protein